LTYSLHRNAANDITEAARFYWREGGSALANRFLTAFERIATHLSQNPAIGTPAGDDRRWFALYGFPYAVI